MPMEGAGDEGTNKDGSKNKSYCRFCYSGGKFTEPGITVDGMIEKVVGIMKVMNLMDEDKVRRAAKAFIPTIERWKK
ncbi:MAG: zinc ribbon domain-containing protein [Deltaproteobacteria bacterium]|nr:zinc ribbon domain-containing protein [Deltaproteobacteria bacterium]